MQLFYSGDPEWPVEEFDLVALQFEGSTFDGEIRKIHLKAGEVTVRFEDWRHPHRTTQNYPKKSARVPLSAVELTRRTM